MKKVYYGYGNSYTDAEGMIDPETVEPAGKNAYPTSRLLDGSQDHGYAQEWAEPATMPDGRPCLRIYLFDDDEVDHEDAVDYPWDDEHVKRIELLDED
jgi:hypothetical protein